MPNVSNWPAFAVLQKRKRKREKKKRGKKEEDLRSENGDFFRLARKLAASLPRVFICQPRQQLVDPKIERKLALSLRVIKKGIGLSGG